MTKTQTKTQTIVLVTCTLSLVTCLVSCTPRNTPDDPVDPIDTTAHDTTHLRCAENHIGFLSCYDRPELLIADGDDDEASAWLWFHSTYPAAPFIPFSAIQSTHDLDSIDVLFWLRDIETDSISDVFTFPASVTQATPAIAEWYRAGGNIILWSHAVVYIEQLGRLPVGTYTAPEHDPICSCGKGHLDYGHWLMAVQLYPGKAFKKDHSTHPLFQNITIYDTNDLRGIMVKGPGWTEDHNCLFYNYPSEITHWDWQQEICYSLLTEYFGIYPLAVWDSQINWVSQLNIYELKQGQTDYKGRAICIGNGGCEFSMRNPDGTPDVSPCPTNNIYQKNILQLAKNAIEYMRSR